MAVSSRSEINGLDDRETRRVADLYANDQQSRDARPVGAGREASPRRGMPLTQIMATVVEGYADRPALGKRTTELVPDPETGRPSSRLLPRFDTISYAELWAQAGVIAADWRQDPSPPLRVGEFVAVLGFTSPEYATIDVACVRLGAVSVPLQASASTDQLKPIIAETEPRILASSVDLLDTAVECALSSTSLRRLVVFDYRPEADDERERFESARDRLAGSGSPVMLDSLATVIRRGATLPPVPLFEGDDDRLAMLLYTSGSTGTPKGAMYTDRLVRMLWQMSWRPRPAALPAIGMNFTPMSHLVGRLTLIGTLAAGGTAYFPAKSDMSTLFEDIALVRPTELLMVPRVCEALFQFYQGEVERRTSDPDQRAAVEAEVRRQVREQFLG